MVGSEVSSVLNHPYLSLAYVPGPLGWWFLSSSASSPWQPHSLWSLEEITSYTCPSSSTPVFVPEAGYGVSCSSSILGAVALIFSPGNGRERIPPLLWRQMDFASLPHPKALGLCQALRRQHFLFHPQWHKALVLSEPRSREWRGACTQSLAAANSMLHAYTTKQGPLASAPVFLMNS